MRIKILFQKEFTFSTDIAVRISDINYGGHIGNDSILSIVHEARLHFLAQWQYNEMNVAGASLIMADSAVQYKGEGFYGDTVTVEMYADVTSHLSFDLYYKLTTIRNNKSIDIAYAKTGMLCFDYHERKIQSIPSSFLAKISCEKI